MSFGCLSEAGGACTACCVFLSPVALLLKHTVVGSVPEAHNTDTNSRHHIHSHIVFNHPNRAMRVICDVHTCVAQGFCSRQQQKHNGNEARRQSEREQEYSNPRWPLPFCHSEENQLLWTSVHSSKSSNKTTPDEVNPASKISAVSLTKIGSFLAPREIFNLFFLSK